MATKLKNMRLTSVDLVQAGANQAADICIFKSLDGPQIETHQRESPVSPTSPARFDEIEDLAPNRWATQSPTPNGKQIERWNPDMSIKIDKSLFSSEELKAYEALIAKASVEHQETGPEEETGGNPVAKQETKKEVHATPPPASPAKTPEEGAITKKENPETMDAKKSATPPELAAALSRLETLEKSMEMKHFTEIAKKYAPLGDQEEELAKTLYDLKKSNESSYTAYLSILDKSLDLVNKSGLFAEIGKSASGYGASRGGVVEQIEKKAEEIMKSNNMDRSAAMAKAWEDNPDLAIAYEEEREGR